jgi:hypothetical protein
MAFKRWKFILGATLLINTTNAIAADLCSGIFNTGSARGRMVFSDQELSGAKRVKILKLGSKSEIETKLRDATAFYTYEKADQSPYYTFAEYTNSTAVYQVSEGLYALVAPLKMDSATRLKERDNSVELLASSYKPEADNLKKMRTADKVLLEGLPENTVVNVMVGFKMNKLEGTDLKFEPSIRQKFPELVFDEVLLTYQSDIVYVRTKLTLKQIESYNSNSTVSKFELETVYDEGMQKIINDSVYEAKERIKAQNKLERGKNK